MPEKYNTSYGATIFSVRIDLEIKRAGVSFIFSEEFMQLVGAGTTLFKMIITISSECDHS